MVSRCQISSDSAPVNVEQKLDKLIPGVMSQVQPIQHARKDEAVHKDQSGDHIGGNFAPHLAAPLPGDDQPFQRCNDRTSRLYNKIIAARVGADDTFEIHRDKVIAPAPQISEQTAYKANTCQRRQLESGTGVLFQDLAQLIAE